MGKGMRHAFPLRALALATFVAVPFGLPAAPASFSYGGHLNLNGNPVTGAADLQFRLFSAPTGGTLVNPNPPVVPVTLNNGDFSAAIDLTTMGGQASIQDNSRVLQGGWVEVSVRRPGEQNFTPLLPRQQFSSVPGALYAEETAHAGLADRVAAAGIGHAQLAPGAVQPDSLLAGTVVRSLNGMTDDLILQAGSGVTLQSANGTITISATGGGAGAGWSLSGNGGTTDDNFLGTTDERPLVLKAGGVEGLRLEKAVGDFTYGVNLLVNQGGDNAILTGSLANSVLGGQRNVIAGSVGSMIGGGENNIITNTDLNFFHYDKGRDAVIPGGVNNIASGNFSFAAGSQAEAIHQGAFVWGDTFFDGNGGTYPDRGPFASIRENEFAVRARGGVRFVTGGAGLMLDGPITGKGVSLPTGSVTPPQLAAPNAGPGRFLTLDAQGAFVWADAPSGAAGDSWSLAGNSGTTDDQFLGTTDQRPLILKVGGLQAVRYETGPDFGGNPPNIVGGPANNAVGAGTYGSFIGTGSYLTNGSFYSFIGAGNTLEIGTNSAYGVLVGGFDNLLGDNSSGSLLGGGENNRIADSVGAVLTGGIENLITNSPGSLIGGGEANRILPTDVGNPTSLSVIAGGGQNQIVGSSYAAIGGGANNVISLGGGIGTIAGGQQNKIVNGGWSTIGGGLNNQVNVSAGGGTIGGGANNSIGLGNGTFYNAGYATVPGGYGNTAAGEFSFAAGLYAQATNTGSFVWSDGLAGQFDQFFSVTDNEFAVRARGGVRFDTGGKGLTVDGIVFNPGGNGFALGNGAVTAAKLSAPNPQPGQFLTVDGNGSLLWAPAPGGGGGAAWLLGGNAGTADGQFLGTTDNRPLELRAGNQPGLRLAAAANASAETGVNVLGGYGGNSVATGATGATIGGGGKQDADGTAHPNHILGSYATVAGGFDNFGGDVGTVVGGGSRNRTTDAYATVAGGLQNSALGNSSTVGGGFNNQAGSANGLFATTGGGANNIASGEFATVPGGSLNQATGLSSFAAGHRALATNDGAFVWADGTEDNFGSLLPNEFAVRARNGVRFDTGGSGLSLDGTVLKRASGGGLVVANNSTDPQANHSAVYGIDNDLHGSGVTGYSDHGTGVSAFATDGYAVHAYSQTGTGLYAISSGGSGAAIQAQVVDGGALIRGYRLDPSFGVVQVFGVASDGTVTGKAFNTTSDRHAKEGFAAINPRAVLDKVAALPISQWQFKGDGKVSHLGPMAQDFHAAFGLGQDDKHIATVDEEGVALAAIQGLHQVMQEKDAEIHDLKQSVAELKAMVEQIARQQNK